MTDEGVDYDVHDFPTAVLGLKLGGFMLLRGIDEDAAQEVLSDEDKPEENELDADQVDHDMTAGLSRAPDMTY